MTTYLRFFDYDEAFNYYCKLIDNMTRGVNRNNHARIIAKPALILSIIKLIEEGKAANKFTYEELDKVYQETFGKFFIKSHQLNLTPLHYPYYYLQSEKFWHLVWINAEARTQSPSRAWIERNTRYACIDQELWILLSHPEYREKMKLYIIEEKVLKVFKEDEKGKGVLKTLLQLLMVI